MEKFEIIPELPDAVVQTDETVDDSGASSPAPAAGNVAAVDSAISPSDGMSPDIARLIEEAEQRGYLRGRNEQIEAEIMSPSDPYFGPPPAQPTDDDDDSCPGFLAHLRPGFWD